MANRKDDDQEMSMEEILASIRKYVTEDDPDSSHAPSTIGTAPSEGPFVGTHSSSPQSSIPLGMETSTSKSHQHGDDVLDLKHIHTLTEHPLMMSTPSLQDSPANDVTSHSSSDHHGLSSLRNKSVEESSSAMSEELAEKSLSNTLSSEQGKGSNVSQLTSPITMSTSVQSLSHLVESTKAAQQEAAHIASGSGAGGHTLESIAIHAMTPYIKDWLDTNLPALVERLVQKEIEQLTKDLLKK